MQTYGLGKGSLLRLLEARGAQRRRQGLTELEVQTAIRLYGNDWSLVKIGEHLGRHHSLIVRALQRCGTRQANTR